MKFNIMDILEPKFPRLVSFLSNLSDCADSMQIIGCDARQVSSSDKVSTGVQRRQKGSLGNNAKYEGNFDEYCEAVQAQLRSWHCRSEECEEVLADCKSNNAKLNAQKKVAWGKHEEFDKELLEQLQNECRKPSEKLFSLLQSNANAQCSVEHCGIASSAVSLYCTHLAAIRTAIESYEQVAPASSAHDPMLAIGNCKPKGGNSPPVLIYELREGQPKWERIEALTTVEGPVHDVAFAPYMGQSYHTFAVAADRLYVFYIRGKLGGADQLALGNTSSKYKFEMACGLEGSAGKIWRVCWNVSGTILTSSGEDGTIRFWTRNHLFHWNQCKVFNRNYLSLPCQHCCQGTNDGAINRISSGQVDPHKSSTTVPQGSSFA